MMSLMSSPVMAGLVPGLVPAIHVVQLNRRSAFDPARWDSSQRRARGWPGMGVPKNARPSAGYAWP